VIPLSFFNQNNKISERYQKNYDSSLFFKVSDVPSSVIDKFQHITSPSLMLRSSAIFLGTVVLSEPPVTTTLVFDLVFMFITCILPFMCIYMCNVTLYKFIYFSLYKKGNIYILSKTRYVIECNEKYNDTKREMKNMEIKPGELCEEPTCNHCGACEKYENGEF